MTVNIHKIDTRPESGHDNEVALTPPPDFQGDGEAYKNLIRERYSTDPGYFQQLAIQAKRLNEHYEIYL